MPKFDDSAGFWTWRSLWIVAAFAVALVLIIVGFALFARPAHAGDPTGYWHALIAQGEAPPAAWWGHLASGKGLCCAFADGVPVEPDDVDTTRICAGDSQSGELVCKSLYRVRLNGAWIIVEENALITEPNLFKRPVVWPYTTGDNETKIRCFLPGAGG